MDDFKEGLYDIVRPFAMLFTFVYLALVFRPCFLFTEDLLWVFILEDWVFMGWWFIMLLCYCVVIVAFWMLIVFKIGLWE